MNMNHITQLGKIKVLSFADKLDDLDPFDPKALASGPFYDPQAKTFKDFGVEAAAMVKRKDRFKNQPVDIDHVGVKKNPSAFLGAVEDVFFDDASRGVIEFSVFDAEAAKNIDGRQLSIEILTQTKKDGSLDVYPISLTVCDEMNARFPNARVAQTKRLAMGDLPANGANEQNNDNGGQSQNNNANNEPEREYGDKALKPLSYIGIPDDSFADPLNWKFPCDTKLNTEFVIKTIEAMASNSELKGNLAKEGSEYYEKVLNFAKERLKTFETKN